MDAASELEICANCKKEIPHYNYLMHTAHCTRNISVCNVCKEPIPKNQIEEHRKTHTANAGKFSEKVDFPRQVAQPNQQGARQKQQNSYSSGQSHYKRDHSSYAADQSLHRNDTSSYDWNQPQYKTERAAPNQSRQNDGKSYGQDSGKLYSQNSKSYSQNSKSYSQNDSRSYIENKTDSSYGTRQTGGARTRKENSYSLKDGGGSDSVYSPRQGAKVEVKVQQSSVDDCAKFAKPVQPQRLGDGRSQGAKPKAKPDALLPCRYCELELPKLDLQEHENFCGARTDKCNECGEFVMFRYKKLHEETNHGFLKLNDEPGPRPTWDSNTPRPVAPVSTQPPDDPPYIRPRRMSPIYTVDSFDFSSLYSSFPNSSSGSLAGDNGEKRETYKDISRRLDCKTEYIRNLLHDSASITVPLRRSGIAPRNHFNHNKGQAPQPPSRRRNPPTELTIPCEFCNTPIPHEELILHETGCRPDLARLNTRRRSPSPEDYFRPPQPGQYEEELPCEFCSDMFPASQLLGHQAECN